MHQASRKQGCRARENRVARVMRAHRSKTRVAMIRYANPTVQRLFDSERNEQLKIDLTAPDQVWVGDITYVKVGEIYRYLAMVMDKYSRRMWRLTRFLDRTPADRCAIIPPWVNRPA